MSMFRTKKFVSRKMETMSWYYAGGPSYLLSDNLEYANAAAAAAAGWVDAGTPVWGYTTAPAPLEGSYSLAIDSSSDSSRMSFTDTGEVWGYFMMVVDATILSGSRDLFRVRNSGGTDILKIIHFSTTGSLRVYNGTLNSSTGTFVMTAGSVCHLWWYYKKGTGADGVSTVWINTTSTKPGSPDCSRTGGNATTDAAQNMFGSTGSTGTIIFDKVRVSSSVISSSPA